MTTLLKSILLSFGLICVLTVPVQAKDAAKSAMPASASASASTSAVAKAPLLDINSASKEELAALPKIGDVRSDAIIKGRPYSGKDDLLNKKVLPKDAYNAIKNLIIAKQKTADKKK